MGRRKLLCLTPEKMFRTNGPNLESLERIDDTLMRRERSSYTSSENVADSNLTRASMKLDSANAKPLSAAV